MAENSVQFRDSGFKVGFEDVDKGVVGLRAQRIVVRLGGDAEADLPGCAPVAAAGAFDAQRLGGEDGNRAVDAGIEPRIEKKGAFEDHVVALLLFGPRREIGPDGRVSATTALVGTMLSIKPIMHTSDEGKLVPVSKARGRKAAINALLDKIEALAIRPEEQTMFICHADCELDARAVAQRIKDRFGTKTVYINYIGPVIGSHTGPNTMGIFFVGTQR